MLNRVHHEGAVTLIVGGTSHICDVVLRWYLADLYAQIARIPIAGVGEADIHVRCTAVGNSYGIRRNSIIEMWLLQNEFHTRLCIRLLTDDTFVASPASVHLIIYVFAGDHSHREVYSFAFPCIYFGIAPVQLSAGRIYVHKLKP